MAEQEETVKENKEADAHVGFKVGIGEVGNAQEQQQHDSGIKTLLVGQEQRIDPCEHNPQKFKYTKFHQVVQVLVMRTGVLFGLS